MSILIHRKENLKVRLYVFGRIDGLNITLKRNVYDYTLAKWWYDYLKMPEYGGMAYLDFGDYQYHFYPGPLTLDWG